MCMEYWITCPKAAFTAPAGLVGDLGRNPSRTGHPHLDTSLVKSIPIAERVTTEFRAQVYNLTNTPSSSFRIPITTTDFGQLLNPRLYHQPRARARSARDVLSRTA